MTAKTFPSGGKSAPRELRIGQHRRRKTWLARMLLRTIRAPISYVEAVLFSEVKLERAGHDVNIRLVPKSPRTQQSAPNLERDNHRRLLRSLKAYLDSDASTRRDARALVHVESRLIGDGAGALSDIPVATLTLALEQLDRGAATDARLRMLRSRISIVILKQSAEPPVEIAGSHRSDFGTRSQLTVTEDAEVSESQFFELNRQNRRPMPTIAQLSDFVPTEPFDRHEIRLTPIESELRAAAASISVAG